MFNKIFKPLKKDKKPIGVRNRIDISNFKKDFEDSWTIFVSNDEVQLENLFHKKFVILSKCN